MLFLSEIELNLNINIPGNIVFSKLLSHACKLSRRYSNHCVRATGATILTVKNYAPAQIMSVTGHKSAGSLTVYQGVDDAKKIEMGQALGDHIASLGQEVVPYTGPIASNGIRAAAPRQDESAIQLQNLQLDDWNFDVDFFPNNWCVSLHNNQLPA